VAKLRAGIGKYFQPRKLLMIIGARMFGKAIKPSVQRWMFCEQAFATKLRGNGSEPLSSTYSWPGAD